MAYVNVPKDFAEMKNKLLLGMTKRQLLAAAVAVVICLPLCVFLYPLLGNYVAWIPVPIGIPMFFFGFYTGADGRPTEKVIANYITVRYRRPIVRIYQTENLYARLELAQQIQEVIDHAEETSSDSNDKETGKAAGSLRRFTKRRKKKDHSSD